MTGPFYSVGIGSLLYIGFKIPFLKSLKNFTIFSAVISCSNTNFLKSGPFGNNNRTVGTSLSFTPIKSESL